ncbi:uncharacterized protein [Acropora muricata]|uniref:uncharacterized protein n=1 Tax=Acropora muricata TaxID=159855 RepID=UPI0034E3C0A3
MVSACRLMEEDTCIRIERVDFSDPQGGKGACDRKAATVKAHVRRYVNEGHNVVTVREFHDAMLSHGGINGVRVALVTGSTDQSQQVSRRWEGISTINNFVYTDKNQVTVWKAFDTGPGKSVRWSGLQGPSKLPCQSYVFELSPGDFVPCWEKKPLKPPEARTSDDKANEDSAGESGLFCWGGMGTAAID